MLNPKGPEIVINLAAGIFFSPTRRTLTYLGESLNSSKVEGVTGLPYRTPGLVEIMRNKFPPTIAFEDAWNPGKSDNLIKAVVEGVEGHTRRTILHDQTEPPLLQDTLPFPSKDGSLQLVGELMVAFPEAHFISADINQTPYPGRTWFHAQSEFRTHHLTTGEVKASSAEKGLKLVYDPLHPLEERRVSMRDQVTKSSLLSWQDEIAQLSPQIVGIDLHTRSKTDWKELVDKNRGFLADLMTTAVQTGTQFARIELLLPSFGLNLKDIVAALKNIRRYSP